MSIMSPKLMLVFVVLVAHVSHAVVISKEWLTILKEVCKENENVCMSVPVIREVCTFSSVSGQFISSTEPLLHLMLPIIVWSPLEQFPKCREKIICPKCVKEEKLDKCVGWTNDGSHSPRLLHDVTSNVLLVSRIYQCNEGHYVYGHHPRLISIISSFTIVPFALWHSTGFTLNFVDFVEQNMAIGVSMLECERQIVTNRYITFSKIQKKFNVQFKLLHQCFPSFESVSIWRDSPTRHAITGCFLQRFWENEPVYNAEMAAGSVSQDESWLCCDHTFGSVANFGLFREMDGCWVEQYAGLFCVLNGMGEVVTWKLTKSLSFENVRTQLQNLQDRLKRQEKNLLEFYIDNCCSWRNKLQEIFGSQVKVKLDLFHAVQRISKKVSKRHSFHKECLNDLKLAFRECSDKGSTRTKSTPDPICMRQSLVAFQKKWEKVESNGVKVLLPSAVKEIGCILKHVDRGCLSYINPGRGTNRNERLHRDLNHILTNSRYGIELGYALLTSTLYQHNERIRAKIQKRIERPITATSVLLQRTCEEKFGLTTLSKEVQTQNDDQIDTDKASIHELDYEELTTKMKLYIEKIKKDYQGDCDSYKRKEDYLNILYQAITQHLILKQMEHYSSTANRDENVFFISFLASAMLQRKDKSFMSQAITSPTDDHLSNVLSQWKFKKVSVNRDGNCLFTSVSLGILQLMQHPTFNSKCMLNFARIGITTDNQKIADISALLRRLMVTEWLGDNSDYYQKFVSFDIRDRATTFLSHGQFSGDLGDLMVVTLSNILCVPIVIFTSNPDLPIICITPTTCIESVEPLYLAYTHEGAGHYDYAVHVSNDKNEGSLPSKQKITKCYCGRKKGFMGTPCMSDVIGNCRCPCARKGESCNKICKCKDCSNRNGQKPIAVTTRTRESYKNQEQPLCGRKGSDFLKIVQEEESVGSMSTLERLIVFAIFVYFMLQGYESTSESVHRAFLDVWEVASECPFIEIPIFKRSQQYIARYLLRVRNIMSLFFEQHGCNYDGDSHI